VTPSVHHARLLRSPLEGVYGVDLRSDRTFDRHWHDGFGFGVMEEGGHRSASGRGPVEALAGQVVTSNPGEVHDGMPMGQHPRRWRMVHVAPKTMASLVGSAGQELTRPVLQDPQLFRSIGHLMDLWSATWDGADRSMQPIWEEALAQVCGQLVQTHGNRPVRLEGQMPLERVRECLLDRLQDPPSLSELAHQSGLSRFQLVRQFARAYGLPPFAWLQQQRLRQAQSLIARGLTLSEAAFACGFADQSHLNRHFVRCLGFTPGQWQRACRGPLQ
jgi:AraC-like DNA-binding protein